MARRGREEGVEINGAVKLKVVSRPGKIVCSECRKGWNGTTLCVYGGELATRLVGGCRTGELLKALRPLYGKNTDLLEEQIQRDLERM